MRLQEPAEIPQVTAELFRRHGRVLPPLPCQRLARDVRRGAQTRLSHPPDLPFLLRIVVEPHVHGVSLEPAHEAPSLLVGLLLRVTAELDQEPSLSLRQEPGVQRMQGDRLHVLDQALVHPLQSNRTMRHHFRHGVRRGEDVLEAGDEKRTGLRFRDKVHRRFQHRHAGALRADESARDVEALLGKQVGQVVAGDPAGNIGEPLADPGRVRRDERLQGRVDLPAAASLRDGSGELLLRRLSHAHPDAVVGDDVELGDLVRRARALPRERRHDGMDAAGVVADHASQRAVLVAGGVGPEGQAVLARLAAQVV